MIASIVRILSLRQRSRTPRTSGNWRFALVLLGASVALLKVPGAENAPSTTAKSEPFDVIYLSDARPVVIRFQIIQEGMPLQDAWNRFIDVFFAKLDSDKNGILDAKELSRLQPMTTFLTSQFNRVPTDMPRTEHSMNRAEFAEYLKKNDLGPLRMPTNIIQQIQARAVPRRAGAPSPEELDKAIVELLDTDKDGKISVAEFTAGVERLSKLDVDENELVSVEEIMRRPQSPYFVQVPDNGSSQPPSPGVELYPLSRKGTDLNLAKRMLIRYGPKPPASAPTPKMNMPGSRGPAPVVEPLVKRLSKKDIKMSDAAFAALDQDGDEELDTEELARFGHNAQPEIEIAIRLGKVGNEMKPAHVLNAGYSPVKAFADPQGNEVTIEVPAVRLDLRVPPAADTKNIVSNFRSGYLNRFRNADQDGNGYLDMNEVNFDPVFRELFAFLDRDGDGKIFEKELVAALDEVEGIVAAASTGMSSIDLRESGRGLFGVIDSNGDGKLSIPELRAMSKLVERFASDKDAGLAPNEVPRRFEASFSMGISMSRAAAARAARFDGMNGTPRPPVGPIWFQKMDRNRDGYVSRREFLGTDEDFRKIDLDGDGFISVEEAAAADKSAVEKK